MEKDTWLTIGDNDDGRRLDRVLRKALKDIPLSAIHRTFRKGGVRIDGEKASAGHLCSSGERVCVRLALVAQEAVGLTGPSPSRSDLDFLSSSILFENDDLLFVNKPRGMLIHDGIESLNGIIVGYLRNALGSSVSFVPGPLHRLDRNTSGIVAFSKSISGARAFSAALVGGAVSKTYVAVFQGRIEAPIRWEDIIVRDGDIRKSAALNRRGSSPEKTPGRLSAKSADTAVAPVAADSGSTLAAVRIHTGRTHQIRAQASSRGHPLLGDLKYGGHALAGGFLLHAARIAIDGEKLAACGAEARRVLSDLAPIAAPLPKYFAEFVETRYSMDEKEVYSYL